MKKIIQFSFIILFNFSGLSSLNAQFKNNHYGPFYMVTADALNVRAKADLSSRVVDRIQLGAEVMVLQTSDSLFTIEDRTLAFKKIRYKFNQTVFEGWVWSGFLTQAYTADHRNVYFVKYEYSKMEVRGYLTDRYSLNRLYQGEIQRIRNISLPQGFPIAIHTQGNLGLANINKAIIVQAWDSTCCEAGEEISHVSLENYALQYIDLPKIVSLTGGEDYCQLGYLFPTDAMGDDKHIYLAKLSFNYEHHFEEPNLEKLKAYLWNGSTVLNPQNHIQKTLSSSGLSKVE